MRIQHLVIKDQVTIVDPDAGHGRSQDVSDTGLYTARQKVGHSHSETLTGCLGADMEKSRVMTPVSAVLMGEAGWRHGGCQENKQEEEEGGRPQAGNFRTDSVWAFPL